MVQGMSCFISFDSVEVEQRFLKWVEKGNIKSASLGVGAFDLKAGVLKVGHKTYLFQWTHFFLISLAGFLRLMFWLQLRKVRKQTHISSVKKQDLVSLVIERGLKNV
jgi:hypothetical protein